MKALTERQRSVLGAIAKHTARTGYPPTYRELARVMGMSSTNGVAYHTKRLERKGYLERDGGGAGLARAWRITEQGARELGNERAPGESAHQADTGESGSSVVDWL